MADTSAPRPAPHPVVADGIRRIPSVDFVADDAQPLDGPELTRALRLSATHFHASLGNLKAHVDHVNGRLPALVLPRALTISLTQPMGNPAQHLAVEAYVPGNPTAVAHTLSTVDGLVVLRLPAGAGLRRGEKVKLTVRGLNGKAELDVVPEELGVTGIVGTMALTSPLTPLPVSVIASLEAMLADQKPPGDAPAPAPVSGKPLVKLGDCDDEDSDVCTRLFGADAGVDRFRFGVLFRLVEPRTSVLTMALRWSGDNGFDVAARSPKWKAGGQNLVEAPKTVYVDRVPVDQPISVDGFRDQIVGLDDTDKVQSVETVPMAGTLGLGYIVDMAQRWTPLGVTLGDLVYSLPLAPGEQQRVAIFERRDVSAVMESEQLSVAETQAFQEQQDTSAQATFNQAFSEAASGGSTFWSHADSESTGFNLLVASGGGGGGIGRRR
jgi:hypothetical protein